MRVEVRLFATLAAYLPPTSRQGVVVVEVAPGSTVRDVIRHLGIPADLERVSLVNGGDAADERPLQAGDVVTLFPPLAGGSCRGRGASRASGARMASAAMVHSGPNGGGRDAGSV